jgi:hypothetical protein
MQKGDFVQWTECSPQISFLSANAIKSMVGETHAELFFIAHPVPICDLKIRTPTEQDRQFWKHYLNQQKS